MNHKGIVKGDRDLFRVLGICSGSWGSGRGPGGVWGSGWGCRGVGVVCVCARGHGGGGGAKRGLFWKVNGPSSVLIFLEGGFEG